MSGLPDCEHKFVQVTTQQLEKELGEVILYAVRVCFNCKRVEFSSLNTNLDGLYGDELYRDVFPKEKDGQDTGDRYLDKIRKLVR